jgi:hypothetical protein
MKILLELRPALDGHAGIPQETRLLFRGLAQLPGVQVDGLLQSSQQRLANGLPADEAELSRWPMDKRINRLSPTIAVLAYALLLSGHVTVTTGGTAHMSHLLSTMNCKQLVLTAVCTV